MLTELTVENLAIIERTHIHFGPGFSVLTGETGAGKSLLIDAIQLAIGGRADTDLIRTGAQRLSVVAQFGPHLVTREVLASGRSQTKFDGKPIAVGALRAFARATVDLCGQHDHQSLLDPALHLGYLDSFLGQPGLDALADYQLALEKFREAERNLAHLKRGLKDREQRIDLLTYQIQEIEAADIVVGEFDENEQRIQKLRHAERLAEAIFGALNSLSDDEANANDQIGVALRLVESAARIDPALEDIVASLASAQSVLADVSHDLRSYSESLEADPKEIDERQARQDVLKRLRKKYGADEAEVLAYRDQAQGELDLIGDADASEEKLGHELQFASQAMLEKASVLTSLRKEAAVGFSAETARHLQDLAMDRARFSVSIRPADPSESGLDDVEFFFSANLGEDERPLAKIASGGEISRVMLAIKAGLAGRGGVPTLIFDEVDAGLSGRAAVAVARKLAELGQSYQVLVITHSPQIAAAADSHFRIEKLEVDGRVVTRVVPVALEDRVLELARMLTGDHVTESAKASARDLMGV